MQLDKGILAVLVVAINQFNEKKAVMQRKRIVVYLTSICLSSRLFSPLSSLILICPCFFVLGSSTIKKNSER